MQQAGNRTNQSPTQKTTRAHWPGEKFLEVRVEKPRTSLHKDFDVAQNAVVALRNGVRQKGQERRLQPLMDLLRDRRRDDFRVFQENFARGNHHGAIGHFEATIFGAIQEVHNLENFFL